MNRSLIKCYVCNKRISPEVSFCPNCGLHITQDVLKDIKLKERKKNVIIVICIVSAIILISIPIILLASYFSMSSPIPPAR